MNWMDKLFCRNEVQRGTCTVTTSTAEAVDYLNTRAVHAAASIGHMVLPDALAQVLTVKQAADLATLKREGRACGVVLTDGEHALDASRIVADLRRSEAKKGGAQADELPINEQPSPAASADASAKPAPMMLDIDAAIRAEGVSSDIKPDVKPDEPPVNQSVPTTPADASAKPAPMMLDIDAAIRAEGVSSDINSDLKPDDPPANQSVPTTPTETANMPASEEVPASTVPPHAPLFLLYVDNLDTVPSLSAMIGVVPDLVILAPGLSSADGASVREACLRGLVCAADTVLAGGLSPEVQETAHNAFDWFLHALQNGNADGQGTAVHLLERGREGGYAQLLGQALHERYDLPLYECGAAVIPQLFAALNRQEAERLTHALAAAQIPQTLPPLRLMDIRDMASSARHPRLSPKTRLDLTQLETILRGLYQGTQAPYTIDELIQMQARFFDSGRTLSIDFRLHQLTMLAQWIDNHEADIEAALLSDLGKCAFEAYETEIMLVRDELKTMRKHLRTWAKDKRVHTPLIHFPSKCFTVRQPYGRALIMSPWNYPFLLSVDPLLASIAGGNCTVLKPSAYAPATSTLLARMVSELYDPEYVAVVTGGRTENQSLLQQKFDTIFFTGSVEVGKLVMKSAAEHLCPVTLELGGKSPCIVDESADVALAARRITWGKFINAGQTCVCPDYVLCHASKAEALLTEMTKCVRQLYGEAPLQNPELCHIVNQKHFERLTGLLEGMQIVTGGKTDAETLKIEPTILRDVSWSDGVMQEEIFGPILPVLVWDGELNELLATIEARPRPLAAYLFTRNKLHEELFLRKLRFGGGCINDVLCHLATSVMPFGGVGESGMGGYHGKHSFDTFTHEKSILKKSRHIDIKLRYAPYGKHLKWLKKLD